MVQRYPFIFVRSMVPFPDTEIILALGRASSIATAKRALTSEEKMLLLVSQRRAEENAPSGLDDMYTVGTLCRIEQSVTLDDAMKISCMGINTVHVCVTFDEDGIQMAEVAKINVESDASNATLNQLQELHMLVDEWNKTFVAEPKKNPILLDLEAGKKVTHKELSAKILEYIWNVSPMSFSEKVSEEDMAKSGLGTSYQTAFDRNKILINKHVARRQEILEAQDYQTKFRLIQDLLLDDIKVAREMLEPRL